MKKICFVTTISLTLRVFVLKTAEYIHANTDWDISMICSDDADFASSLPPYIHYYPVKMERGISASGVKAMLEMKKIFQREKFDLIQYSTPNASLYASLAGWLTKVPVRLYCQWGMAFVGFSGFKRKVFKAEEKLVCSLSTWVEPDSNSNLRFAHKEGLYSERKGSVIWNGSACGVDLNKFDISKKKSFRKAIREKYGIPADAFVVGFVGRVTRDKGVNELLEAFQSLKNTAYLLMVGPSEVDNSINNELYQWSIGSERVIYAGYSNVVEQFLSAMDCYVLPSYREGFGMGVVEAEAMGVPVIVTNIPGPIDAMVDGKTGIVIPVRDVDALISAIKKLSTDAGFAKACGSTGVEHAKNNFEQTQLFERILEDRKKLLN